MENEALKKALIESEVTATVSKLGADETVAKKLREVARIIEHDGKLVVGVTLDGHDIHELTNGVPTSLEEKAQEFLASKPQARKPEPKAKDADKMRGGFSEEDFQKLSPSVKMAAARRAGQGPKVADSTKHRKATPAEQKQMENMTPVEKMKFARQRQIA